jgi:ABC-type dipeptide/oligopeptide/nickel transport system ATPase subunit
MNLGLKNLTVLYEREVPAALQVSFTCNDDEIVGITGPSGAGKSTLGRCIAGLQKPLSGEITIDGRTLNPDTRRSAHVYRKTVQFVFQDPLSSLPTHLPVRVPLLDAGKITFPESRERRAAVARLLRELDLDIDILERKPAEMSGGQRQRVALARALIVEPKFLVLDEVTSALDPVTEKLILELLESYRRKHRIGIICISHDLGTLLSFCTRILVYRHGRIVEVGEPKDLYLRPEHSITKDLKNALPKAHRDHLDRLFMNSYPEGGTSL